MFYKKSRVCNKRNIYLTICTLRGENSKIQVPATLRVGEWFHINRNVIEQNKEKILCKCNQEGTEGKKLWARFNKSNKIANDNPDQYPNLIDTYIFQHNWNCKTEEEMRNMCNEIGNGMCDEVICDLELQMRICNGESVNDLIKKPDKLPCVRVIKLINGESAYFGGGIDNKRYDPPSNICKNFYVPTFAHFQFTPYAFRYVLP